MPVLVEGFVVKATCAALTERGWTPVPVPHTTAHGIDITATKGEQRMLVEAKGAGSSVATSARYGKPFTSSQVYSCVAKATYKALTVEAPDLAAVAFPSTPQFQSTATPALRAKLRTLGIVIFWVSEDGSVQTENDEALR